MACTYFKEDAEKAFIAESEDGLRWRKRNGGEPVFTASVGTGQLPLKRIVHFSTALLAGFFCFH